MKTLTEQIADARATHDIFSVLGIASNKKVIVCPLPQHAHKNNTPSFSIFTRRGLQWWRCHGSCNAEGDIIDLIGYLRVPGYDKRNPDHIRSALILLDERYEVKIPEKEVELLLAGNEWRYFLPPSEEVINYAASRGLTLATLEKFRVGQSGHYMAMPAFEEGILRGIKMRNINKCEHKYRFFQLEGSRLALFNYDAVNLKRGLTWIVKGEIPVMLMDQIGFPQTCAPTGGEGSGKNTFFRWNTAVALAAKIVVGDNDIPGRELAQKRGILFGAEVYFPPERYKDIDEWIQDDLDGARSELASWEEHVKKYWFS